MRMRVSTVCLFPTRLLIRIPWADVRWWLLDIARECVAMTPADRAPREPRRIWVLSVGRREVGRRSRSPSPIAMKWRRIGNCSLAIARKAGVSAVGPDAAPERPPAASPRARGGSSNA